MKASQGESPEVLFFLVAWKNVACGRMLEEGGEEALLGWLLMSLLAGQVKKQVKVQMEGELREVVSLRARFHSLLKVEQFHRFEAN